ncbi:hypothetical protein LOAG_17657 [Loa loa]|uniref:Uncharacterized protein n=1 Tax=Loa loa TaxID=7209 RepID=A0A1S0UHU4_LOALO|nr:hypothetical protein LOAG_17657 [Loa loa]EJD75135.1 hypothetical protein LOAG_17657 [Loa loa]
MKRYQLLLLSNHILRIFFLFHILNVTIKTIKAEDIHDSSADITISIDNFGNQSLENHDNYHQSVDTVAKNGASKKVEDLIIDEGFILTTLKQQQRQRERERLQQQQRQRERERLQQQQQRQQQQQQQSDGKKGINIRGNSATIATTSVNDAGDSKRQQNLSFDETNFVDFALIYPTNNTINKEFSSAIHPISNKNLSLSLINQSILNDKSSNNSRSSSSSSEWKFLKQRRNNLNNGYNNRKKRWTDVATTDKDGINEIIKTLSSTSYDSPTIASNEIFTSQDYQIHDVDDDRGNTEHNRFRIPVENIVIVGGDGDDDDDDDGDDDDDSDGDNIINRNNNNEISKTTTFEEIETTDSYEQMSSIEENDKDDENAQMGIVRIAPEVLPEGSIGYMNIEYGTKIKPTVHFLDVKTDETIRKMEMDDNLETDMIEGKKQMLQKDEIDLGTIQEMRISDDPNDAAIACDDETEGSGVQEEEFQEYGKLDMTTSTESQQSSMHISSDYLRDDHNPSSSHSSSSSSSPSSYTIHNDQFIIGKYTDSLILPAYETAITERIIPVIPILEKVQLLETISAKNNEFPENRGHRTGGLTFVEGSCNRMNDIRCERMLAVLF